MHKWLLSLILLSLAILLGCSRSVSPLSPQTSSLPDIQRTLWGLYDIQIDTTSSQIEIVPLRTAFAEFNVTGFLQPPKVPVNLLTITLNPGSDLPNGKVSADVTIQHPFPGTYYCGFDVLGIVMDDFPPVQLAGDPAIKTSLHPATLLQNPDGWTRWWNQSEFTTYNTLFGYTDGVKAKGVWTSTHTLNAFKYFSDDLSADESFNPDLAVRGFFSSETPGINTRRYELQFPMDAGKPVIHLKYAISASWAAPFDTADAPYTPDEWPISANMPEAYKIDIIDNGSTAYYSPTTSGGDLNLLIEVRDWQLDGTLGSVANEIKTVTLESPQLFPLPVQADLSQAQLVPGNTTAVRIPITISNVTAQALTDQLLIVSVQSAHVSTYQPQAPGGAGADYPDGILTAYGIFEAPISEMQGTENWILETVDSGTFHSDFALDIDSLGHPHIVYESLPDKTLKYAHHDGTDWHYISSDIGITFMEGMQLTSNDLPKIVFCPSAPEGVFLGYYDGDNWLTESVYGGWPGTNSTMALDSNDQPHFAIHDGWGGWGVWHKWFDGSSWQEEKLGGGEQLIEPSIILDSEDNVHIMTFFMYGSSIMRYFHDDGSGWIDENTNYSGNWVILKTDALDNLHLAFTTGAGGDPTNGLGYGFNDGSGWQFTVVDDSVDYRVPSLAIDSENHPHICVRDVSTKSLIYATNNGTSWQLSTIQSGGVGVYSSIGVLPGNKPCIAYMDETNTHILFAWKE